MFELPKGIKIGHAGNEHTGCTVILPAKGAVCGCDVRGGGPATRETDLLRNEKMMQQVNAVVLSGGSAYGLESACGVMEYLRENGDGYKVGKKIVPIVPAACIFDLNDDEYYYPDKQMGIDACKAATETPEFGKVGAGIGATVGKIRGVKHADESGIGCATVNVLGVNVTAVVVVNAFGDVFDYNTGRCIAGARGNSGELLNTAQAVLNGNVLKMLLGANTTIGCVITDAKLDKVEANKIATVAHNGLAKTINPVHTDYDGDALFCMATGKKKVINLAMLEVGAVEAVAQAVLDAVTRVVAKVGER